MTVAGDDRLLPSRRWRARFASVEAAAIAGIVAAIGWSIAMRGLLMTPGVDDTPEQIAAFYADPDRRPNAVLLLQILVVATIAFLWFVGVVRGRLGDAEPKLFGTVFLGGAILLAGVLLAGAAALAAPSILVDVGGRQPDPDAVSLMRAFAVALIGFFLPRVATLVILSTAALGRATGALPRWLVWLSYVVGVVEFVNVTVSEPMVFVFPAWIALVSVVLLIRKPGQASASAAAARPPEPA